MTCRLCGKDDCPLLTKGNLKLAKVTKAPLAQVPSAALTYIARGIEFGHSPGKYSRGNWRVPTTSAVAALSRFSEYSSAALRHDTSVNDAVEDAYGSYGYGDGISEEIARMAVSTMDEESGLPHICAAITNLAMAIQQAVDAGLLPADPGAPWKDKQ